MNKKKKTLGTNPLQAYLASTVSKDKKESAEHNESVDAQQELSGSRKQRITIHLPIDLIEKIKNVVFWEPGFTLTAFAQDAFEKAVAELEKERGEPYKERSARSLKGGRPLV